MAHSQINWVEEADKTKRLFRGRIVGWQVATYASNSLIRGFNAEFLSEKEDQHKGMREMAAKRLVIGALCEVRPKLGKWCGELYQNGGVSEQTLELKDRVMATTMDVETFGTTRNLAFHFCDLVDPIDSLMSNYREIDQLELSSLVEMLEALIELGNQLKMEAWNRC